MQVINFSEALHTRSTLIMYFISGAYRRQSVHICTVGKQERKMTIHSKIQGQKNAANANEQPRPLTQVCMKMLFSQSCSVMFCSGDMVCIQLRVQSCASSVSAFHKLGRYDMTTFLAWDEAEGWDRNTRFVELFKRYIIYTTDMNVKKKSYKRCHPDLQ